MSSNFASKNHTFQITNPQLAQGIVYKMDSFLYISILHIASFKVPYHIDILLLLLRYHYILSSICAHYFSIIPLYKTVGNFAKFQFQLLIIFLSNSKHFLIHFAPVFPQPLDSCWFFHPFSLFDEMITFLWLCVESSRLCSFCHVFLAQIEFSIDR